MLKYRACVRARACVIANKAEGHLRQQTAMELPEGVSWTQDEDSVEVTVIVPDDAVKADLHLNGTAAHRWKFAECAGPGLVRLAPGRRMVVSVHGLWVLALHSRLEHGGVPY